jgi:hypothetical protein
MCCVRCIAISVMWWCCVCTPDSALSFFVLDAVSLTYIREATGTERTLDTTRMATQCTQHYILTHIANYMFKT